MKPRTTKHTRKKERNEKSGNEKAEYIADWLLPKKKILSLDLKYQSKQAVSIFIMFNINIVGAEKVYYAYLYTCISYIAYTGSCILARVT